MNRDQLVAGGVAAAAFACSAQHIFTVAAGSGNPWPIAAVHPVGLDGLIYIGMRAVQGGRRWQGWLATVYGVGMSLTFNGVSYAHIQMPAAIMAVAMPVALVLAVLVVGHEVKPKRDPRPVKTVKAHPVVADVPAVSHPVVADVPAVSHPVVADVPAVSHERAAGWDKDLARKLLSEGQLTRKEIAERVGCSRKSIDRLAVSE